MTIVLIILAAIAATYIYAVVGYYYAFKNWLPVCAGCTGPECNLKKTA